MLMATVGQLPPVSRPDIVYIMADDLGYGDVGCFGQTKIPTPNIDRLAREGVRLTRAYSASPVCAPTRYSLLTGKHQGHAAIRGNKERGGFGPNDPEGQTPIATSETTLAEVMKSGGYRTGIVGKWGLGGPEPGQNPLDHGFDTFYGYLCQRRAHNHYPVYLWKDRAPDLLGNPVFNAHQKVESPLVSEADYYSRYGGATYAPEAMAKAAVDFVERTPQGQPLFLYYAPTLPHIALQAPKEWVDRFPREWDTKPYLGQNGYLPNARPIATYAAMVAFLDHTVGQVMAALEKSGRAGNALIVFTSDNGAYLGAGGGTVFCQSNGDLRSGKMSLYEGGVRVPFVARWPGKIPAGTSSQKVAVCYDALATLSDAAGLRAPKSDGESYLPSLLGKAQPPRSWAYWEYPEASAMQSVVLDGRWKVIRPDLKKTPSRVEVYDLASDPGEKTDLGAQRPELVERGLKLMSREHKPSELFPLGQVDSAKS